MRRVFYGTVTVGHEAINLPINTFFQLTGGVQSPDLQLGCDTVSHQSTSTQTRPWAEFSERSTVDQAGKGIGLSP